MGLGHHLGLSQISQELALNICKLWPHESELSWQSHHADRNCIPGHWP